MAKAITLEEKKELLALKQEDLSVPFITGMFGKTAKRVDGKMVIQQPKFNIRSPMHLDAGEYINEKEVDTTVGCFLFNKLMVEGMIEEVIPNRYFNGVADKKGFNGILDKISAGVMTQKIPVEPNLIKWLKHYEFYGMKLSTVFSPSYTEGLLKQNVSVVKKRKQLLKGKDISKMSVKEMTDIEDELVAASKEILKNDPGMTLFSSGSRGSFDNDYKNMNLMLGPVAKPGSDGEYDFVTHGFIEGLKKEDFVAAGNSIVNAAYPKAVGTQDSGYLTKQYYAAYQSIRLDKKGTDCGSKIGLPVTLTEDVYDDYCYQYVMTRNGGVELLTPDNKEKWLNKKVMLRTPMTCKSDCLCNICAGERFYIMKIENSGLTTGRVSNTLLNASMKNFHNVKLKYDKINLGDLLI